MKRTVLSLSLLAAAFGAPMAQAEVTEDQVKALEARIAQLETSTAPAAESAASRIKINGFMSAGIGMVDKDDFGYVGLTDTWGHEGDGIVGLQIDGKVNEQMHAVTQLVARSGGSDFDVSAEWAYIGYKPTARDEIRVGLQRFPFFMMSEYLEVGYAYPWATPPTEVYLPGMPSSYNGISWQHNMETGDWTHRAQIFWGNDKFPSGGGTFELDNSTGLSWLSSVNDWQFGLTYTRGESTYSNQFFGALTDLGLLEPTDHDLGWYGGLSAQYDNGKLLVMAEAAEIHVDGYFPDTAEEYVTVGYRFGKFMPHLTYSSSRVIDDNERKPDPAIPGLCGGVGLCLPDGTNGSFDGFPDAFPTNALIRALETTQDSVTIGVRYDFLPNADLKVDWTHVLDTHDTFGDFFREDGNVFYGAMPGDDINAFRVVVDVVF